MGILYLPQVIIEAEYNSKNVQAVLSEGEKHGCIYYEEIYEFDIKNKNHFITSERAAKLILSQQDRFEGRPSNGILTYNDGAYFILYFTDEGGLQINLRLLSNNWEKEYSLGKVRIDFFRYFRLLFNMCDDHPLYFIGIEKL